jgi:hypothetical protein
MRLCRASGRVVSTLDFSSVGRTSSRRVPGHSVVRRDYPSRGRNGYTSPTLRVPVPRHIAWLVIDHAPSRRSTSRRSVAPALDVCPVIPLCVVTTRLAVATDILRLRYASGCLDTSRGSSSTTSTTPRVRVPRHVARLVKWLVARLIIDYIDYAARPGASARRAARR